MIQDIKDDIDHKELAKKNMKTEISALDIQKSKAEKQLHDERAILEMLQEDLADQEAIVDGFEQEQLEKEQLKKNEDDYSYTYTSYSSDDEEDDEEDTLPGPSVLPSRLKN